MSSREEEWCFSQIPQNINFLKVKVTGVKGEGKGERVLVSQPICQGKVFLETFIPPYGVSRNATTKCHTLGWLPRQCIVSRFWRPDARHVGSVVSFQSLCGRICSILFPGGLAGFGIPWLTEASPRSVLRAHRVVSPCACADIS